MSDYSELLPYCQTDRQVEVVQALVQEGSQRKAARHLDIDRRGVERVLQRLRKYKAKRQTQFDNGEVRETPQGFTVKGESTLYDAEGNEKLKWVKTAQDRESQHQQLLDAIQAITDEIKPSPRIKKPTKTQAELINVIPMGDPHVGLYCWSAETGNDFDCKIAEDLTVSAIDHLVTTSPKADQCLIINLGDFYHADTAQGITLRSGHKLDVDTRWGRVLEIGIRAFRRAIDKALEHHAQVTVINAIGNHDDHSSKFLGIVLREYYRNNPRVTVQENDKVFQYHQFGKNLFGITHGHTIKPNDLEPIMTRDCNDIWSETQHRKWFIGHFHSQRKHDMRNCEVEYYRTLAPGDAWSVASGYRSFRDMRCETYHREHGFLGLNRFDPIMLG